MQLKTSKHLKVKNEIKKKCKILFFKNPIKCYVFVAMKRKDMNVFLDFLYTSNLKKNTSVTELLVLKVI